MMSTYAIDSIHDPYEGTIPLYGDQGFQGMRKAGVLAAKTLDFIGPHVQEGCSTGHLDRLCHDFIRDHGAIPAPLGYNGFPRSICTSLNHVVCHGIPNDQKYLRRGDILNIDVTVILDGWYGDTSRMFSIAPISVKAQNLIDVTYASMMRGIRVVKPGATLGDVGHAIQSYAESQGFSVVRDFCGHGLGREFHISPSVLHYGRPGTGMVLKPGMFFTIEPMINVGKKATKILPDGWTAVTRDKSLSAQFEHSIGVTEDGCEIFTEHETGKQECHLRS